VQNEAQWDRHARWWQSEFTAGADPEYEDQILPLVARHLAGSRRVLDVSTAAAYKTSYHCPPGEEDAWR